MAGTVFISDDSDWAASSSVFYWVVDALADRVTSVPLVERLREISEFNLGSLNLADLPSEQRAELTAHAARLPAVAAETLPDSTERQAIVAQVQELSNLLTALG